MPNGKMNENNSYDNSLIFQGEYLNGKRNGKGKEYYSNSNILYDGNYLHGKRNGEGKEYYYQGNIKFEGEYKNGLPWNGKGYDIENNNVYVLNDGKGLVKLYNNYDGNLIFVGDYLNGKENGKGKEYYFNN